MLLQLDCLSSSCSCGSCCSFHSVEGHMPGHKVVAPSTLCACTAAILKLLPPPPSDQHLPESALLIKSRFISLH